MDPSAVGRRIAYWRERRGFTQTDFGQLMGQTKRWVQDIEGGKRQQDPRLSVLTRAADVLRIPLEQLLADDKPVPPTGSSPPAEVLGVIDALYRPAPDTDPPTHAALQRRLTYCCEAFQACHYATLARELPALMTGAGHAAHAAPAGAQSEAQAVLSRVYQLVTSYLHKYGESTATQAALAADRALVAAERSGDPVQIGAAARRVVKSLVYQQRPETAVDFATNAARTLSDELAGHGPLGLSTLGMLYLSAALAVSSQERTTARVRAAGGYVDEAGEVAARQGADLDEDYTMFGPTNVALHRMDMLLRFEDGWAALEAADGLSPEALAAMTRERQAGHRVSVARASLLTRRKDDAAKALLEAEALAPEEVRGRPDTIRLVKDVVGATPKPKSELRALAERCGLRA
ncbi:helix-turn-helix domain-containing protein [Streptomyces sp. NEAU-sy36]|uniref:helix-turn-helix domain-containing protein n=1 Tax=unclassified Streptomyces TaxID=2593676 RepID=UPI0015D57BAD|nr:MULTISPECIES: helix-turn-helix transcriptional regulator [unclassified Streptomyces]QLJ03722.1 helix-turn-helix domain-containing protein [Streptomyces sp. NEAU-sy36]